MADDDQPLELIDQTDPDTALSLLDPTTASSSTSTSFPQSDAFPSPKLETADDFRLLPTESGSMLPKFNFRKQKRHRVMQSCVACHTQKRKVRFQ